MSRHLKSARHLLRTLVALCVVACAIAPVCATAHNYKFHRLYSFCAEADCSDGGLPQAPLLRDQNGNLYGTTSALGAGNQGTVFKLTPAGKKWKQKTLYSFCSQASCADGRTPQGNLIIDTAGNLYGTTAHGGSHDAGIVYELIPSGKKWRLKILHDFCQGGGTVCADGSNPAAGLAYAGADSGMPYDGASTLYGTTSVGGGPVKDGGTAFKLELHKKKWKQTVLYAFCSVDQCTDGAGPHSALTIDAAGNLYGTTSAGGSTWFAAGVVYRLNKKGNETVLYAFCPAGDCPDGATPTSQPLFGAGGKIFGTTYNGGANGGGLRNGTIFEVSGTSEQVDYDFCGQANCADGAFPKSSLIMDASGNIFGTTNQGGGSAGSGGGTVFEYKAGAEQVLYGFCAETNCTDGQMPTGGVIMDAAGNLFGTTEEGGANGLGTVFELEF